MDRSSIIANELIGRVYEHNGLRIILGVRKYPSYVYYLEKNNISYQDYNFYEILVGELFTNKNRTWFDINVHSWIPYDNQKFIKFECRSSRKAISNCVIKRPELIHYHTGLKIDLTKENVKIKDNCNYYSDYLNR